MSRSEDVVFALGASRITAEATFAADRVNTVQSVGEHFVGMGLMTHIEDDFVGRRVEDVMQRDGHFNGPKGGG